MKLPRLYASVAGTARASMTGGSIEMRQRMTTAEVRLDHGKAARINVSAQSTGGFDRLMPQRSLIAVAQDAQRDHPGPTTIGNPGNVGSEQRTAEDAMDNHPTISTEPGSGSPALPSHPALTRRRLLGGAVIGRRRRACAFKKKTARGVDARAQPLSAQSRHVR